MAVVKYDPHKFPNAEKRFVDMASVNNTAQVGDWLIFSGNNVIAAQSGLYGAANATTAYFRASGIGIALANNPSWNSQGSAFYQSALPVGVNGQFDVTGVGSATAGFYVYPLRQGSGVVGQTGLTGQAAIWTAIATLPIFSALGGSTISASAVANSGVGRILRIVGAGDPTAEWEIELIPPVDAPFLVGGAAMS